MVTQLDNAVDQDQDLLIDGDHPLGVQLAQRHLQPAATSVHFVQRVDAIALTDQQVLREPTCIGVDGAWRTAQVGPDLKPLCGSLVPTQDGPLLLDVHV